MLAALAGPVLASGPFSPGAPLLPAALPASPIRDERSSVERPGPCRER